MAGHGAGGRLVGLVMGGGGYGLAGDIVLGSVGGIAGSWIFRALGFAPGRGPVGLIAVAFIGAAILIVAGRALGRGYARLAA